MDEAARREWLAVAWGTLEGVPPDLLSIGCQAARKQCDHPSKIVRAIFHEIESLWAMRRAGESYERPTPPPPPIAEIEPPIQAIPVEEIRAMTPPLRRMGLAKGWITQGQIDAACGGIPEDLVEAA